MDGRTQCTVSINGQNDILREVIVRFPKKGKILDIGMGSGKASRAFCEAGWQVEATGFNVDAYFEQGSSLPDGIRIHHDVDICDMSIFEDESFDAIWCAHVLEHVMNMGRALEEIRRILKPDGKLFISVPPFKHAVVGGHVNTGWNIGNLMYVLAVAGFDLSNGSFVRHGYNLFGSVSKGAGPLPQGDLHFANGDIEFLAKKKLFPKGFDAGQGFDGNINSVNWLWQIPPKDAKAAKGTLSSFTGPMRIAFFVPWITKGRGGTENVGHMMANAMADKGHHVDILTFDNDQAPSRWPLHPDIGMHHLPEEDNPQNNQVMQIKMAQIAPDLIVGLHMNRTFGRYVKCAMKLDVPIVLSEHIDPTFPQRVGTFSDEERQIYFSGATRLHLLVDAFKSTLPMCLQDKITIVPNTIPTPGVKANPGQIKDQYTLITVARLVPRKNLSALLHAFAGIHEQVPDWKLKVVGGGGLRKDLEALARELSIKHKVEFVGHTDEPYRHYVDADLFVLPSLHEGFPMTGLEAMAHGLPMVGYALCNGINVQIEDGKNGILASGGRALGSLGEDLLKLMNDQDLRTEMGKYSKEKFDKEFSQDVVFTQWENLFLLAIDEYDGIRKPNLQSYLQTKLIDDVFGEKFFPFKKIARDC
ncbi:glycosyltransferase [Cohaesibacter intestini]|uniref:glycosyltransferase n=1 Tax=Cohaesibacter intestini TaxID=2211145 RepID=UPI0013005E16|nr:glycosyltransferase [Cohaesibacter intestini]